MSPLQFLGIDANHKRLIRCPYWVLPSASVLLNLFITVIVAFPQTITEGRACDEPAKSASEPVKSVENSIGMKLAFIPSGTFMMGAPIGEEGSRDIERPVHEVVITHSFYMGVFEVTQEEFENVMGSNPSYHSRHGRGSYAVKEVDTSRFPAETVTWGDAVEFCQKLSERPEEKAAGRVYRLPTEAEWEYACRGGTKEYQVFHFGNSLSWKQANFLAWYPYGSGEKGVVEQLPRKVGSYPPNGFGLHDMHGNVNEWCSDRFNWNDFRNIPREDPQGPNKGELRIQRGGGWWNYGEHCRSSTRGWELPSSVGDGTKPVGFRVVSVLSEK